MSTECCVCRSGTSVLRQLYFAMLDLTLHAQYFPRPGVDVEETQLYRDVVNKASVLPPIPGDRYCNPEASVPACLPLIMPIFCACTDTL